jgi:serine/threonine protein kinase
VARSLRHPYIVPFLGALRPDPGGDLSPRIVSLWMPHGTIHSFCASNPAESKIKYVSGSDHCDHLMELCDDTYYWGFQLRETLYGLQFMHDLDFVHADIKGVSPSSLHTLTNVVTGRHHAHTLFPTSSPTFSSTTRPVHASLTLAQPFLGAQLGVLHAPPNGNAWTTLSSPPNS